MSLVSKLFFASVAREIDRAIVSITMAAGYVMSALGHNSAENFRTQDVFSRWDILTGNGVF